MTMFLLWFTGLGLAGLSDAVRTNGNADVTLQQLKDIDCSKMRPAGDGETFGFKTGEGYTGNVDGNSCDGNHFILDSYNKKVIIVMEALGTIEDKYDLYSTVWNCEAAGECIVDKSGNGPVWDYLREMVHKECKDKLCKEAKKGSWYGMNPLKRYQGRKMPWPATMSRKDCGPFFCPQGYEDVFKLCWKGPKDYPGLLPDFEKFADKYKLINDKSTFNKTACD